MTRDVSPADVRPVLKWAGGKRQLLPELLPFYPEPFARYVEPIVGSGAVFLDLLNSGRAIGHEVRLSDINADIIGCYRMIRDAVDEVIGALWRLDEGHRAGGREHFYDVRDRRFNPARRAVHASRGPAGAYTPELAAMLIYLNRTGYNGLFRVNSQGEFNVPVGRHGSVRICDPENLRRLASAFGAPGVAIEVLRFDQALEAAGPAVLAGEPHVQLHLLHGHAVWRGRAGLPAAERHRACLARRPRAPQQLLRARHQRAVRGQRRGEGGRPADAHGPGAAGDQLAGVQPRARPGVPHHERAPGRLTGRNRV